jgi:hypothetical protein
MPLILFYIARGDWMYDAYVKGALAVGIDCEVCYYSNKWSRIQFTTATESVVEADMASLVQMVDKVGEQRKIDLIFFCTSDDNLTEDGLKRLSKKNIPMVQYHPDMGFLWFRILRFAKYFSLIACAQQMHMNYLQRLGYPVCYLPFAATPFFGAKFQINFSGVRYLGSPFANRAAILGSLHKKSIPLEVYGHNWDWFKRKPVKAGLMVQRSGFSLPLPGIKQRIDIQHYLWPRMRFEPGILVHKAYAQLKHKFFPRAFDVEEFYGHIPPHCIKGRYDRGDFEMLVQTALINIGFSHMYQPHHPAAEMRQMRLRDVEIPMAGGFYMAEYCSDIAACFEDGKHLVFWHNEADLAEKVRFFLKHPEKAIAIAVAGQQHAMHSHTWSNRYRQLFKLLSLKVTF